MRPAGLPVVRPEPPPTPAGLDLIIRRKTGPTRYVCSGWLVLLADAELMARACSAECLAKVLPQVRETLADRPWAKPEPGPEANLAALMREPPR